MKILWIDPGGTTGWCMFECTEVHGPEGVEYFDMKWDAGEIEGEKHYEELVRLIELQFTERDYTVGYEDFHWQEREDAVGLDYNAPKYIGAIELVCSDWNYNDIRPTVVSQFPSERLFVDDKKLNIFGLYMLTRGKKDARAAARHLLTYLIKTKKYPPIMRQLQVVLNK